MQIKHSCSGLTMVELVSALTLFILIMGALTMALNKATTLWSTSHTSQPEQEQANLILNLIADDLQLAVTDNGTLLDSNEEPPPTFLCDTTTNQVAGGKVILQFVKYRTRQARFDESRNDHPALDAVFYTFFQDQESVSLSRHVIPLMPNSDPSHPELIGKQLEELRAKGENSEEPTADDEYSLLTERLTPPIIVVGIPSQYVREENSHLVAAQDPRLALQSVPEYNQVATAVLPDYVDISLRIFNEKEWIQYNRLALSSIDDETFKKREAHLGTSASRRITFKAMRGTRLP